MQMNALAARMLVDAAHLAWSNRDTTTLLACYCDDICYTCNTGSSGAESFRAVGKQAMLDFLLSVLATTESMSIIEGFAFKDSTARANVACFVKHKATGHVLNGTYRQILTFCDGKIASIDEYHDAARIAAFWKMVDAEALADPGILAKRHPAGHD
jgi:ketosteroid isomerase-like protein